MKNASQGDVLRAMHRGGVLNKEMVSGKDGTKVHWTITGGNLGKKVTPALVERMIGDGLLVANGDGLFDDSQTYRLARGEELQCIQ